MLNTSDTPRPALPSEFLLGAATSAYQIEGAASLGGRGASIWDTFCHLPGKTFEGHDGAVACDHYHRWEEDVALLRDLGVDAYRFSISWPRVLPTGRGPVNEAGLAFYERLVDALLAAGIQPWITLYHWDLPQALEDLGGWRAPGIVDDFAAYAECGAPPREPGASLDDSQRTALHHRPRATGWDHGPGP